MLQGSAAWRVPGDTEKYTSRHYKGWELSDICSFFIRGITGLFGRNAVKTGVFSEEPFLVQERTAEKQKKQIPVSYGVFT